MWQRWTSTPMYAMLAWRCKGHDGCETPEMGISYGDVVDDHVVAQADPHHFDRIPGPAPSLPLGDPLVCPALQRRPGGPGPSAAGVP